MAESKRAEHRRLQNRTGALKREHLGLSRERTPFNQRDHEQHAEHLLKHQTDLAQHKRRNNE